MNLQFIKLPNSAKQRGRLVVARKVTRWLPVKTHSEAGSLGKPIKEQLNGVIVVGGLGPPSPPQPFMSSAEALGTAWPHRGIPSLPSTLVPVGREEATLLAGCKGRS